MTASLKLDTRPASCHDGGLTTVRTIISGDGKHRLDIHRSAAGFYSYTTYDDRYRDDPDYPCPSEWRIDASSGLYGSAEAAEIDAFAELPWLREDG